MEQKTMEWVFYYRLRSDEEVGWGGWKTLWEFPLWILIGDRKPPEIKMDPSNPRIEWKKALPPKKENEHRFELPSLYHVPFKGSRFHKIPAALHFTMGIKDHEFFHRQREEEGKEEDYCLHEDEIYLENRRPRKEWINVVVEPCWREMWKKGEESRTFFMYSQIMGEWKTASGLLEKVFPEEEKRFHRAVVSDHLRCRLSKKERQEMLREELWNCTSISDAWWMLMELYESNPQWDRHRLRLEIVRELMTETWRSPALFSGAGMWTNDNLLDRYAKILSEFSPVAPWLFSALLRCKNKSIRHRVINERMIFTMPFLTRLEGCEKGDLQYCRENADFVASSSGLVVYPDNPKWYLVNVRRVNYRILPNGSYISIIGGSPTLHYNGITKNEYYFMDRETLQPVSGSFAMKEEIPNRRMEETAIVGVEDVRLVARDGNVFFYGVTKEYAYMDAIRIIQGKYDVKRCVMSDTTVIRPPYEENSCEKNWSAFGDRQFIYRWHPIEIGHMDTETKRLVIDEHIDSPPYFEEFRGSSPGIRWRGYYWFTTHSVSYLNGMRKYVHYVVVMDMDQKKVVAVTTPFGFESLEIEYTVGLDVDNGRILFLYSTRDSTSRYVRVPLLTIVSMFRYLHDKNAFQARIFQIQK
jgi:hypothetical protein